MNGKFEDFKITTRVRSLNLWIQILLGIALYAGLNFAAARHYQRFDMSENRRNSLSPESVAYVKNLRKPVEIYAVVSMGRSDNESAAIVRDFNTLFRQYEYASNKTAPVSAKDDADRFFSAQSMSQHTSAPASSVHSTFWS